MKILHLITGLSRGGAEHMLYQLLEGSRRERFRPMVVSLTPGGIYAERIAALGVQVATLGMIPGLPDPVTLLRARKLVRRLAPDIVHGWMYHGALTALLAAQGRPVIGAIHHALHDLRGERFLTRRVIAGLGHASQRMERIVYCAQAGRRQHEAIGYDPTKGLVIQNGFDCARLRPMPEARAAIRARLGFSGDAWVIGHLGRYHPVKNHSGLLEAFACIAPRYPRACLVLAGAGVDVGNPVLGETISRLDLADRVHLLGERDDVPELLNGFDILVNASRSEAFPNVVGEAMACGVPCVATDVGDSAEIVGDTGLIVPPRAPVLLAEAISKIAGEPAATRRTRGRAARARIEREFSLPSIVSRYEALYEQVARGGESH